MRTKDFDVTEVLTKSMLLFWQNGYEKTSFSQIIHETGVNKQSLYNAFGDKRALFLSALELYRKNLLTALEEDVNTALTQNGSSKRILRRLILGDLDSADNPSGCLIVNTSMEFGINDESIMHEVRAMYDGFEATLEKVAVHGQQKKELSHKVSSRDMAVLLSNTFKGFKVAERMGTPRDQLEQIADQIVEQFCV
jgi:AcrR family transcriptional regulator